jgi:predicted nucleic acid-binding protein
MLRIVLDTNVLVGAAYAEHSASAQIAEACLAGRLEPVLSPQLRDEYEWILPKAIRLPHWRARYHRLLIASQVSNAR